MGKWFVLSYIVQLALVAYAMTKMELRTPADEKLRRAVIGYGLLPFLFVSILGQLLFIGLYHLKATVQGKSRERVQQSLSTTFDTPGAAQPAVAAGANPFAAAGMGEVAPASGANPFADSGPEPGSASGSNPFG